MMNYSRSSIKMPNVSETFKLLINAVFNQSIKMEI